MSTTPQKTASIVFTADEARVLLELINAAVKSLGLNAAEAAAVLAKKINGAFLEGPTGVQSNDVVSAVANREVDIAKKHVKAAKKINAGSEEAPLSVVPKE